MKHTKKMFMVPEEEYLALLTLLSGNDPIALEKAKVQSNISKNLQDPKVNPSIKMATHNKLLKVKDNLQKQIDDKPHKVIVENISSLQPSYPAWANISKIDQPSFSTPSTNSSLSSNTTYNSNSTENTLDDEEDMEESIPDTPSKTPVRRGKKTTIKYPYISPKDHKKLLNYLEDNKEKFHITEGGEIISTKHKPVLNSDYKKVIKYMSNTNGRTPPGTGTLYNRLKTDPFFQNLHKGQEGSGKLIPLKIQKKLPIKKQKVFRPVIWAKI